MTGSRLGAAVVGTVWMLCSASAWADPTPQEREKARDLMADGRDKRDKLDLAGALGSFQQADTIMHVPTTGFEVAKTQQALGQLVEAQATCKAIGKLAVAPNEPAPFAEARKNADTLAKDLEKQTPKLTITIKSPSPATVTVDNVAVASLDQAVRVNPGPHTIYAKAPEGEAKQDVTLAASESKMVELQIAASTPSVAATPAKKHISPVAWAGFGVGVAGLAVGTIAGVIAINDKSDIKDSPSCNGTNQCGKIERDPLNSAKHVATISTVGFIVAGVGVAVGVVGLVFLGSGQRSEAPPPPTASIGPIRLHPTTLSGTF